MRKRMSWCLLGCLSAALALAQADAGDVRVRTEASRPGPAVLRDVAYGPHPAQRLDVYLPDRTRSRATVIVMVHGGAWRFGDKDSPGVVSNKRSHWGDAGAVLVSVNYRMLPDRDALAQAGDVAAALAYVQRHAPDWGLEPGRVVLMGHSAGAHLVALLTADPARAYALGARPWSGTVALDSAAMDVPALMGRRHGRLYDAAFGQDPARWRQASPRHALTSGAPPLLVVCSTRRPDRPCEQARDLADSAAGLGLRVQVIPQDLSHREINRDLGLPGPYTAAVDAFIASLGAAGPVANRR